MALELYKRGQGSAARIVTAVGLIALAAFGANALREFILGYTAGETAWAVGPVQLRPDLVAAVVVFLGAAGAIGWVVSGCRRVVDFLILTEGELRKVSWPSRRDLWHQTVVVIVVSVFFGIFILICDLILMKAVQLFGLLPETVSLF